jgi:hypothetical protein
MWTTFIRIFAAAFTRYGKNKYGSDNPFCSVQAFNIEEDI